MRICNIPCCVGLGALPSIGDVSVPTRLPRPQSVLLPSTSTNALSAIGSETPCVLVVVLGEKGLFGVRVSDVEG